MRKILIIGSLNMDLIATCQRFAQAGETIISKDFQQIVGGKGGNQAVAASRLGAQVCMLAAVGDDAFGIKLLNQLSQENVDIRHIKVKPNQASGCALINVVNGENSIVVNPGANYSLSCKDIYAAEQTIAEADVVLSQLEIPIDVVSCAAKLAQKYQIPFILNPAPAQKIPTELFNLVSLLTPNQHELAILLDKPSTDFRQLLASCNGKILMTQGENGSFYASKDGSIHHQTSFSVEHIIDSTGAGDTFNATLAVYWQQGIKSAMRMASAAAALSVTRLGAQSAMPSANELIMFLAKHCN